MDLPDKVIVPGPIATPMVIEDYARYMGGQVVVLDIEAAVDLWIEHNSPNFEGRPRVARKQIRLAASHVVRGYVAAALGVTE